VARENRNIPTLDGWRGFAVIAVILYHGRSGFFNDNSVAMRLSAHGDLGVNLFFAISGFLICGLLLKEFQADGNINLRRFYLRRCFRILPPYYAVLAVLCILSIAGAIRVNYSDLPGCLLFYRNFTPLGGDYQGGYYTAHLWSLAIEEHFYLLWPMLLLAVRPKRAGRVAFLLAMTVFAWRVIETRFHLLSAALPPANLLARTASGWMPCFGDASWRFTIQISSGWLCGYAFRSSGLCPHR
jgi:peptidoglycan/LPS O-acetylase OafA/YrhL